MSQPATLIWFARHETRLLWRRWISMMTAGKRSREPILAVVAVVFAGLVHLFAYFLIAPVAKAGISPDKMTLITLTGAAFLSGSLMLSQAMESVTRAFYGRADLDLILSSPVSARRVFAVRMMAIALSTTLLTTVLAGPFINALVVYDGSRWFAAYGVILAMGTLSAGFAIAVTVALFRGLGPKRTRLISQIISAVVGAGLVIGAQAAAIISTGGISRFTFLRSEDFLARAPEAAHFLWWPARAAMGNLTALTVMLGIGLGLLALVILVFSASFGDHVVAASGEAYEGKKQRRSLATFRPASTGHALRRKEWMLLRRDPWLMSQTLMQILYLLPPVLLLWHNFGDDLSGLLILVPVIVMASGQLAGGLAWLAVSGEDAPDLVGSAPIAERAVIVAKIEAVLGAVAIVIVPLLVAIAIAAPMIAAVALLGVAVSASSGTMIQIWFRAQAKRSNFWRRQTSSRIATVAEALSSILWAGTAALVAAGSWFASATALLALLTLAGTWVIRPRQANGS
ncbi:MAG: permease [Proteobacteria bacterium]|nr:permease [Pseudomonadota bacterium]